jgi:hypothetical protein
MKLFLFSLLLLNLALSAEDKYSMRVAYGIASNNDLGQIIFGQPGSTSKDLSVVAVDGGYLLKQNFMNWPVDIYLKGGLATFNEDINDNTYEAITYLKAYYNFDFSNNRVRFGFGEGISYTSDLLVVEYDEAHKNPSNIENTSKFLNYLDISLDVDFGKLINYQPMYGTYVGYLLKHRSGIFGLINNVDHGGSNYNSFYIEKTF